MKKLFSLMCMILLLATCVVSAGCTSWWQKFQSDPVAQVNAIATSIDTVVSIATVLFSEVKPILPAAKQEEAQHRFTSAVLAAADAKRALIDAVNAAAAAKDDTVNLQLVIENAVKAAEDLRALIRDLQNVVSASAPKGNTFVQVPAKPDDLDAAVEAVRRFKH